MNGEVEIICLSDSVRIPDLGLTMTRGSRMNVSVSNASRSRDLEMAKAQGIVAVREIKVSVLRTIQGSMSKTEDDNLKKVQRTSLNWSSPNPSAEVSDLLSALKELTKEVSSLRSELSQRVVPVSVSAAEISSSIAEALRVALSGISISPGATAKTSVSLFSDEERFIPSGIVPTNLKADISPNTTNEGAGSLEDAQSALREARRRARENQ